MRIQIIIYPEKGQFPSKFTRNNLIIPEINVKWNELHRYISFTTTQNYATQRKWWRNSSYLNLNSSAHTGACPSWGFVLHVIASFKETMQYWCNVFPGGNLWASQIVSSRLLSSFTVFDWLVFGLCFFFALPQNLDIASIHSFKTKAEIRHR